MATGLRKVQTPRGPRWMYNGLFISESRAKELQGGRAKPKPSRAKAASKGGAAGPKRKRKKSAKAKRPLRPVSAARKGKRATAKIKLPGPKRKPATYGLYPTRRTSKKGKAFRTYSAVRMNPLNHALDVLKRGGMVYGGILGARIATHMIKDVLGEPGVSGLLEKQASGSFLAKLAPYIPGAGLFAVGLLAKKLTKNKTFVEVAETAGVVALGESLVQNLVIPQLMGRAPIDAVTGAVDQKSLSAKVARYLGVGDGGMGIYPGVGAYPELASFGAGMEGYPELPAAQDGVGDLPFGATVLEN